LTIVTETREGLKTLTTALSVIITAAPQGKPMATKVLLLLF